MLKGFCDNNLLQGLIKVSKVYQEIHDQLINEDNYECAGWVAVDLMYVNNEIEILSNNIGTQKTLPTFSDTEFNYSVKKEKNPNPDT